MNIAFLDCYAGICGSMFVGALLDSGVNFEDLKKELQKLSITGYKLNQKKVIKNGITGTLFSVQTEKQKECRHLKDIQTLIEKSDLSQKIQTQAIHIFSLLAKAEAKIHNCSLEEIHFHEVGAVDAIIDIIAVCIGVDMLEIKELYSSPIHLGVGETTCAHGTLPIPAPATLELLQGMECYSKGIEGELTTPTGAALLKGLYVKQSTVPKMKIERIGYGAGEKDLPISNLLRLRLGSTHSDTHYEDEYETENLLLLECGIDDMNPEILVHLRESLEKEGALEVMIIPVQMKKGRPAYLLRILCQPLQAKIIRQLIFEESTSLGVRCQKIERYALHRENTTVTLKNGEVNVKVAFYNQRLCNISPEYESCKSYAQSNKLSLKKVYTMAITQIQTEKRFQK